MAARAPPSPGLWEPLPDLTLSYPSPAATRTSRPAGCTPARSAPSRADTAAPQVRAPRPCRCHRRAGHGSAFPLLHGGPRAPSGGRGRGPTPTPRPLRASGSRRSVRDGPRRPETCLPPRAPARQARPCAWRAPELGRARSAVAARHAEQRGRGRRGRGAAIAVSGPSVTKPTRKATGAGPTSVAPLPALGDLPRWCGRGDRGPGRCQSPLKGARPGGDRPESLRVSAGRPLPVPPQTRPHHLPALGLTARWARSSGGLAPAWAPWARRGPARSLLICRFPAASLWPWSRKGEPGSREPKSLEEQRGRPWH